MNGIVRSTLRSTVTRNFFSATSNIRTTNRQLRTLWSACSPQTQATPLASTKSFKHRDVLCNYSCCRAAHTKAEKELVEFLAEEIIAEKKAQKLKTIPTELDGFKVSLDGSNVTLEKKKEDEIIKISFDINHSVSSDPHTDLEMTNDNPDVGDIKSKPDFTVDIIRGNQTLEFSCSFNSEPGASGANDNYNDIFSIDEISLYTGECIDNVYVAEGAIIDGYLYDLLMNYLEEKGVSNEFAEKIIELSTSYEHTAYVSLLEGLSKFTSKN